MKRDASRGKDLSLSRRDFLKSAAAGAAGLAAGGALLERAAAAAKPAVKPSGIKGKQRVLFNGKDFSGWMRADGKPPAAGWALEDGAMVRKARAHDIWTKERFGDFILDLEMKTKGNSGIFIRTDNVRSCVQTGIEVAIDRSFGKTKLGKHDFGAIYDCLAPTKNALKGADDWQHVVLTCDDNKITIEVNGELVTDMDLNKWTEAHKNPDGSKNKFNTAYKDMKREGHIGFQEHGAWVAYRNVKITPLNQTPKKKGGPACPVCGRKGKEGDYCAKCNAIITELGAFKCTMCGKGPKSGTYCKKHNRFKFNVNDDAKCPKCGKKKGTWCPGCGKYACLPSVTYCAKCKAPFDRIKHDSKCPKCGTKVVPMAKKAAM